MLPPILNPRQKSLVRGNILVLVSLLIAFPMSGFPNNRINPWLTIPALLAIAGTADTVRCIRRRWSFYHAGVILCIYMDLMAITLILTFLLYPYALWMSGTR